MWDMVAKQRPALGSPGPTSFQEAGHIKTALEKHKWPNCLADAQPVMAAETRQTLHCDSRSEGWSSTARAWSNRSAETRKWATAGAKAQGEGEICHGPHHATSANARPHRQQWSRKNPKGIHSEAFSRNFCRSQQAPQKA